MKFSVSICVYDQDDPNYFREALESILDQKLPPNQIVITVDGPINESLEKEIRTFETLCISKDVELTIVRLKLNMGHGEARRIGIENCKYELVAIADADDLNEYERFYLQVNFFENHPETSVLGGQMLEVDNKTKVPIAKKVVPLNSEDLNEYIKVRCPMNQATVMFKKSEVMKAGGYIDFYHNEDYYLWIRMYLNKANFKNLENILVLVRVNQNYFGRRGGLRYFMSEYNIQKIMFESRLIGIFRFSFNIMVRFIIQVIFTDGLRAFIFKKLFRAEV